MQTSRQTSRQTTSNSIRYNSTSEQRDSSDRYAAWLPRVRVRARKAACNMHWTARPSDTFSLPPTHVTSKTYSLSHSRNQPVTQSASHSLSQSASHLITRSLNSTHLTGALNTYPFWTSSTLIWNLMSTFSPGLAESTWGVGRVGSQG